VLGEQGLGQQAVGDVLGQVVVHRQLLEDDLALVVDVAVPQRGRVRTSPRSSTTSGRCSAGTRL
jgi:hypothetical protein